MLEWLTQLRKTVYLLFISLLHKAMIKDEDEHPDGGDAPGKVCGKIPSLSMPLSQHLHVFSDPDTLPIHPIPYIGIFMETSTCRHD